jgi:hypothetical protein
LIESGAVKPSFDLVAADFDDLHFDATRPIDSLQ